MRLGASTVVRLARKSHDPGQRLVTDVIVGLAAACIGVGLLGMVVVPALSGVVSSILGFNAGPELKTAVGSLRSITIGSVALLLLIALVAWLRRMLLSIWLCGTITLRPPT